MWGPSGQGLGRALPHHRSPSKWATGSVCKDDPGAEAGALSTKLTVRVASGTQRGPGGCGAAHRRGCWRGCCLSGLRLLEQNATTWEALTSSFPQSCGPLPAHSRPPSRCVYGAESSREASGHSSSDRGPSPSRGHLPEPPPPPAQ